MQIDRDNLAVVLSRLPLFQNLLTLCQGRGGYVVGGAIRDGLSGLPVQDVDLIFPQDPTSLAQTFARTYGGHWFWLDAERRQSRVVFPGESACPVFDFAPYRAASLGLDLLDRDFTINAIALPLTADLSETSLVDPVCGVADLRQDLLRMVSKAAFANDPLRIVKGVRHATVLGLQIEEFTLNGMQTEVTGLYRVAPERIRQEIWKILASPAAATGLRWLAACSAGNYLFGNQFPEAMGALEDCLRRAKDCWRNLQQAHPVVGGWLASEVEQGLDIETLLLWILLLGCLDKDLPVRLADEWLLSRKARATVRATAGMDERTLEAFAQISFRPRAFAWWVHEHRIEPRAGLLALAAIGALAGQADQAMIGKWVAIVDALEDQPPEELVDGHWLRHELGLPDGPEMSRAQQLLRDAEISGQVTDAESARAYLMHYFENID